MQQKDNSTRILEALQLVTFCILIFLVPSNLFLKFAENHAYVHGLLSDYLLPKLYASDIVICTLFGWWGIEVFLHRRQYNWRTLQQPLLITAVSLIVLGAIQVFSARPISSLWFWFKLIEMTFLISWCFSHRWVFTHKASYWALTSMLIFQSCLGLLQFTTQHSIFSSYLYLGEPRLSQSAGIVRDTFFYQEKILPYGTTAHPNILAGVLVIGLIIVFKGGNFSQRKTQAFFLITSCLILTTLFLTKSWSAWLAGGVSIVFLLKERWRFFIDHHIKTLAVVMGIVFVVSPLGITAIGKMTQSPSVHRRVLLNQVAINIWQNHPIMGTGLNTFTSVMEEYLPRIRYRQNGELVDQINTEPSGARFIQPAHHVGLLLLAEIGILGWGLILLNLVVWRRFAVKNQLQSDHLLLALLPFLPLLTLDHYLWTQQTGQLLFVIGCHWVGYNLRES